MLFFKYIQTEEKFVWV